MHDLFLVASGHFCTLFTGHHVVEKSILHLYGIQEIG